jgi:MFS family permease
MATVPSDRPSLRLTGVQWTIAAIAVIGFAFDTYAILMLPLVVRPALLELTGAAPGSPEFQAWVGRLFYIPAFAGGIFGLLGGYLTDLLGRRRVLTFSILIYALAAFASGFATSIEMLLLFRCLVFIGVSVEFVAAVAWLAELFPDPLQREKVLGYTQACSSLGGFLVATANGLCVTYAASLPAITAFGSAHADPHAPWRYTLMSGLIPALPLLIVRPFLPESPAWKQKKAAGTLKRPSIAALFSPEFRRTTIVTTVMMAMAYGAAFGVLQQIPQIVPGIPQVQEQTRGLPPARAGLITQEVASNVTKMQEVGGLVGRVVLAYLAVVIVSRRRLIRFFQIPGLIAMPLIFGIVATSSLTWTYVGMFIAGFLTVGQFNFWGNYLPRMYPTYLRGTGESFAANIGGRLVGTSFAWVTATLAVTSDRAYAPTKVALVAAGVAFSVYLAGFIASFWLPEPGRDELPD